MKQRNDFNWGALILVVFATSFLFAFLLVHLTWGGMEETVNNAYGSLESFSEYSYEESIENLKKNRSIEDIGSYLEKKYSEDSKELKLKTDSIYNTDSSMFNNKYNTSTYCLFSPEDFSGTGEYNYEFKNNVYLYNNESIKNTLEKYAKLSEQEKSQVGWVIMGDVKTKKIEFTMNEMLGNTQTDNCTAIHVTSIKMLK